MDVVYFPDDPRPPRWMSPVLALGNFDGLHRGHQKIVERIRRSAADRGATALVLTFDPHPPRVVRPDKAPPLLMTMPQKVAALEKAGLHGVAVVRFTEAFSRLSPDQFVRQVLVDWLRVSEVWVGADFLFGHERAGTFSVLRSLGTQYGFRVEKIDPERVRRFFLKGTGTNEGQVRVRRELRSLVTFERLNLLDPAWQVKGPFDAIFCRNVLIYFDKPTQRRIIERFRPMLQPDGLLFVGHSEGLYHCTDLFRSLGKTVYEPATHASGGRTA